jgi:lysophospholipid acyltransferase (LPLAT)-like uncharacterized protein
MVELFKAKSVKTVTNIVYAIFHMQEMFTHIQRVDFPDIKPCIYAMWHRNQMCTYGQPDLSRLNVLVSRSKDGEMIAKVIEQMGYKTIRGSKGKKGAVEASMQMLTALKAGEDCAMMVDGPVGPPEVAKDGVIKLAKMAGVPIVPVTWYSSNFTWVKFPSWDKLEMPIFNTNLINLYGKPVFVSEEDDINEKLKELQDSLDYLDETAPKAYNEVYQWGLWKKKRSDSSQFRWNP